MTVTYITPHSSTIISVLFPDSNPVFLINVVRVLCNKLHPGTAQLAPLALQKALRATLILVNIDTRAESAASLRRKHSPQTIHHMYTEHSLPIDPTRIRCPYSVCTTFCCRSGPTLAAHSTRPTRSLRRC